MADCYMDRYMDRYMDLWWHGMAAPGSAAAGTWGRRLWHQQQ